MKKKQELGQFYTTNSEYIIGNLTDVYPSDAVIVDPFAGNWDLLDMVDGYQIEAYDIDPQNSYTVRQDTLNNPPTYNNRWIITNPPYLAKNKCKDKRLYNKYDTDDLYKASLKSIIGCSGGIIIIPINFFSSRDDSIRKEFLSKYKVKWLRVFEQQVFEDTSYTVCAFAFIRQDNSEQDISVEFLPSKKIMSANIKYKNGFIIGETFLNKLKRTKTKIRVGRLVKGKESKDYISSMYLRAVDTGAKDGRISLSISNTPFYAKHSDRAFATITLSKKISKEKQELIVEEFNRTLERYRKKYHSLFLTNFRNSTEAYARKRIEFSTAYNLIKYAIDKLGI